LIFPSKLAEGITIHTEKAVRQVLGLMRVNLLISYWLWTTVSKPFYSSPVAGTVRIHCFWRLAGGREAVDFFESRQPHLIWMDLRMPGMDGHEAAQRMPGGGTWKAE